MIKNHKEKEPLPLHIMVSIPDAKEENIWVEPIVLGVFETKELAREVWKNRPKEYRDIRAKTIHIYYEKMQTTRAKAPEVLYAKMIYYVEQFGKDKPLQFDFIPWWDGFYENEKDIIYSHERTEATLCEELGWIYHCGNYPFVTKLELNKLTRIPIPLFDKDGNKR